MRALTEGDVGSSSLSGVGFLGGFGASGGFSLTSLVGGAGVAQSFTAGELTVCVHVCKHTDGVYSSTNSQHIECSPEYYTIIIYLW